MKGAVVISTILLLFAGCGKAQPSNKADEMADIMQDIMGMNELMSGKTDGDDPDKPAVVLTHVPTERKETNVQNSRKSPQMPHTESKTMHIYTSSAKRKTDTAPPTPPAPQSKTATVTTATPPTPPTPGVVTMTSSPDHENKYLKHIQKLLLAILLVVAAIFVLVAGKYVISAIVKLASTERKPAYKKLEKKFRI